MASITLKNIPDDLYNSLKAAAQAHHRSINSEMIYCLETTLKPRKCTPEERLNRIANIRKNIKPSEISLDELLSAINEGRA